MKRITLTVGPVHREYLLFVPASTGPTATSPPLVVFLHGKGASATWADEETGWSSRARRERFALAIPQALPENPAQPPKFLTNPPGWQDSAGAEDLAFLAAVMGDAAARVGADPHRVLVSGFSNGAAMAFRVAAELAERVAALAAVAGHCRLPDPRPSRPVPTLYVVGDADPLVPLRGGEVRNPWQHRYVRRPPVVETLETWARAIGCDPVPVRENPSSTPPSLAGKGAGGLGSEGNPSPTPPPRGEGLYAPPSLAGKGVGGLGRSGAGGSGLVQVDTYPGPVEFRSIVIGGLGHHWPGGRGRFNHRIAGPPSDSVNGTELVWAFFKQQMERGE